MKVVYYEGIYDTKVHYNSQHTYYYVWKCQVISEKIRKSVFEPSVNLQYLSASKRMTRRLSYHLSSTPCGSQGTCDCNVPF